MTPVPLSAIAPYSASPFQFVVNAVVVVVIHVLTEQSKQDRLSSAIKSSNPSGSNSQPGVPPYRSHRVPARSYLSA